MAKWDIGDVYPIRVQLYDDDGDPADTTSVTVTVTELVSETTVGPASMTHTATGVYDYDYAITAAGQYRWTAVAAGAIAGAWSDGFLVDTAASTDEAFISVTDQITWMRAQDSITSPDDLETMRLQVAAGCDAVERDIGRLLGRHTISAVFDGGGGDLRLPRVPPRYSDGGRITVGSVTDNGIPVSDYFIQKRGWRLVRGTPAAPTGVWTEGVETVEVTYTAYCDPVPMIARTVAHNTIAKLWQGSQQAPAPYSSDVFADQAIAVAVSGLTAYDLRAYRSLQRPAIA